MVHQAGARFSYIMTKGIMPLLEDFVDIGIDTLWGVDPVQGEADLPRLAQELQGRICIWGGMNAVMMLGEGTPEDAEKAVDEAMQILGRGRASYCFR
jgi:hypothetical protein